MVGLYVHDVLMQMKVMARKMVSNEQGGPLAALQASAAQSSAQQSLGALVVHVVAALISRSSLDILCPLVILLNAPGNMAVSLWVNKIIICL